MIRRDGRQVPPQAAPRAWSQQPDQRPLAPRPPQPRPQPPRPDNRAGSPYAPPRTPQPYVDPSRRRGTPVPPPPRGGRPGSVPPEQPPRPARSRRRPRWGRRIGLVLLIVLVVLGGSVFYLDRSLTRIDALSDYAGRIGDTPGTNWLLVGSDSRAGLTPEQEQQLSTGGEVGNGRTDTIIVVHIPKSGATTMVSIPRDSYVPIPGNGKDKINAAFAIGGAPLLVQTVEGATGLRMDHYAEIGFGGFAGMVDAVGGVNLCVPYPIDDPLAGVNLQPGCQDLTGSQALGFVRSRATPLADLDRMNNQRAFMAALLKKATGLGTMLNPFRLWPLVTKTAGSLQVDQGDHLWNLAGLAWAMRGDLVTTTVPVGGFEDVDGSGNVLLWDRDKATRFFGALADDKPIPQDLLTTN
ncbi:LytR family transcriptional regulator [Rhodococcus spelaei]|uniref:LytR family transcriptional regulator n=1 Tax=Rhodococcus spelaei TaxID=2546320 RepID=A0A541BSB4_9NOCA|nr:LCP family protein [Rhodococcus spelaei]TQF75223.1 LytR family transcriptional regulator [Rhodococcus spelaei]